MIMENKLSIYDFVKTVSDVIDLTSPLVSSHHKRVANIACNIAQRMNLPNDEIQDIVLASMLHDIGAFSINERICARVFESFDGDSCQHALIGYRLLKCFEPLEKAAELVKHHHTNYSTHGNSIPIGSHIIHLADRSVILFEDDSEILAQIPNMLETIFHKHTMFHPDALEVLMCLAGLENVWIETFSQSHDEAILNKIEFAKEVTCLETLRSFARFIARIIDFRSRFTATHSSGVAAVAMELSTVFGFSEMECKQMEIAGFLHDLGKLAIPGEVLEKKGALSNDEFSIIKKHAYYTYAILSKLNGMEQIAVWAAHHHERQDGNGYPFHVHGRDSPMLARIMAVSDIMTALSEDRPYRPGMNRADVLSIIFSMAKNGGLDMNIAELADKNFHRINTVRIKAQEDARKEYEFFHT